ncbi:para-aminobenzoate synthase [Delitschia confertaspora ATCC 74209]|uniref:aminodeoxychorismate synthase n=1 Tax=Delitschia confertaspora ATCC 74209 TaxID=1513339 RepID=A0A9P4JUM9_9PLEO|nr:para-aminobenzoate synthase [Delitschia confertaspora ATCC 74209]
MAPALVTRPGKILYLDAYDSFSNNIIALVEQQLDVKVVSIHIDDPRFINDTARFTEYLKNFDAAIAGPGPGTATNDNDVGLMNVLWKLQDTELLPVLGICLGFQSLAAAYGASIQRLPQPRHGLVAEILHSGRSLFEDVDQVMATQYHSLQVNIAHPIQAQRAVRYPRQLWVPSEPCPDLEPLAWDFDDKRNGAVLMAVRHREKPFWGVQFHPESICTNEDGTRILQNWWTEAQAWLRNRLISAPNDQHLISKSSMTIAGFNTLLGIQDLDDCNRNQRDTTSKLRNTIDIDESMAGPEVFARLLAHGDSESLPDLPPDIVHVATCGSGRLKVQDVCDLFKIPEREAIVLESCVQSDLLPTKVGTGRYSIIGLIIPGETLRLHYYTDTQKLQLQTDDDRVHLQSRVANVWAYIKSIMVHLMPSTQPAGPSFAPFWGGLMGYVSYEAGLETIGVDPSPCPEDEKIADICFAYVTRSIVFDHKFKKIYIQSIRGSDDMDWVRDATARISQRAYELSQDRTPSPGLKPNPFEIDIVIKLYAERATASVPSQDRYCDAVKACQQFIAAGDSYELCLTSQNEVRIPRHELYDTELLPWRLYKNLMSRNPAPFSAFVRLGNTTILSSSPERFMSWDRSGCAQCRPIKGTVRKAPGLTYEDADAILSTPKERAENLMILDLVRHQLHGVYGPGNVHVTQLMEIEEYETLWQLVSVVEGVPEGVQKAKTPEEWEEPVDYVRPKSSSNSIGIDAFVASLPPGSMTGAPKKRSCEILKEIENERRRGIYSGVLGYLDVGGGGDFSVVIRTAVKVDPEKSTDSTSPPETQEYDVWRVGAGGAVTAQSTPEGEYAEMFAKLHSTLSVFQ